MPKPRSASRPQPAPTDRLERTVDGHHLTYDRATSDRMRGIGRRDTAPERIVRRHLAAQGLCYRTSNRDLPGSPDVANRSKRWAVFVHGCYWHRHEGCKLATTPTRNAAFWEAKFAANVARDARATKALRALGYAVLVVWECDCRRDSRRGGVGKRIARFARRVEERAP